jgi:hypothetical protein
MSLYGTKPKCQVKFRNPRLIFGFDPAETSANQFCCIAQRRPETRKLAAVLAADVVGYSRLAGSELLAQRLLGASFGAALGDALGNSAVASNRQPDTWHARIVRPQETGVGNRPKGPFDAVFNLKVRSGVKTAGDCGRIENPLSWKVADYDFESRAVPQSGTLFGIPKSFLTRQAWIRISPRR